MSCLFCVLLFFFGWMNIIATQQSDFDIKYCDNGCTTYFDGCNDCTCNSNGTSICGNNECDTTTTDYCIVCKSNTEWNDCGSSCTKTCDDPNILCSQECIEKCECPPNYPIWDETTNQCIAETECTNEETVNFDEIYCQQGCTSYFNGCNECECNGNVTSSCSTTNICEELQDDYCLECESNKEWTECGSPCVATCDDATPLCIEECQSKCYCPTDTVWNGEQCVSLDECLYIADSTSIVCTCEPFTSTSTIYTRLAAYCSTRNEDNCNSSRCTWTCTSD